MHGRGANANADADDDDNSHCFMDVGDDVDDLMGITNLHSYQLKIFCGAFSDVTNDGGGTNIDGTGTGHSNYAACL
eukprot:CAMPEP_0170772294 /NCGR_PEP_ID=MMETSP0733-20121128/8607_1 /TAXON_ID=186038 /ORGANISM="Fragilariopsis kerguelensis, Strain L26-C5" /LENGTH=75 /DNA_ID=CAMNT_0011114293 /DNA_START=63 /DNA_END=291 /DNA_ORIENTATION=-